MTDPILEVENITLRFGGVTAIRNVAFHVNPGELFSWDWGSQSGACLDVSMSAC